MDGYDVPVDVVLRLLFATSMPGVLELLNFPVVGVVVGKERNRDPVLARVLNIHPRRNMSCSWAYFQGERMTEIPVDLEISNGLL